MAVVVSVVVLVAVVVLVLFHGKKNPAPPILRYQNTEHRFSFRLPAGHAASAFVEGEGQAVLVRNSQGVVIGQLHVSKTTLAKPLDEDFLRNDLKEVPLFDVRPFALAADPAVSGVAFSFEPAAGRTASETWFVRGNSLYQWTAAEGQEATVQGIIDTIVWQ